MPGLEGECDGPRRCDCFFFVCKKAGGQTAPLSTKQSREISSFPLPSVFFFLSFTLLTMCCGIRGCWMGLGALRRSGTMLQEGSRGVMEEIGGALWGE